MFFTKVNIFSFDDKYGSDLYASQHSFSSKFEGLNCNFLWMDYAIYTCHIHI